MSTMHTNTMYETTESRWRAVVHRDTSADEVFVFAVCTTRIYCRPGCPAKTPRREHVQFFDSTTLAERAGFRPCKRCSPDGRSIAKRHIDAVTLACNTIENADSPPTLARLSHEAGMSPHHFHRIFKRVTGLTPGQYARSHRAHRLRNQLPSAPSVTKAIYDTGFQSSGSFYANTNASLGMAPTVYRARGSGEQIRFTIAETSLGTLLVAATGKGICSISFGDNPHLLLEHLQRQFADAEHIEADAAFGQVVARIIEEVERPRGTLDLPLDLHGTAFQHRVSDALQSIPVGGTRTYSQLAEHIGSPGSARRCAPARQTRQRWPYRATEWCGRMEILRGTAGGPGASATSSTGSVALINS